MFDEEGNARVAVEKEVALSFKRVDDKYIIQKLRTVKNVWDYIDFNFIVGQGRGTIPDSIECRSGTKLNSSWGIDIIQYIYTELKMYNEKEAENFILCLHNIVNQIDVNKKKTFNFGLSLVGIKPIEIRGGARPKGLPRKAWLTQTQKARRNTFKRQPPVRTQKRWINTKQRHNTYKSSINKVKLLTIIYKKYYLQELSEIKNHLELMKDLTKLYNDYITTEPENNVAFNKEGLQILNTYTNKQFGISIYTNVDNDDNMDKNESILELDPKDNYYVSYSVIKYYNYIENQYEHFRDGFKIYYKLSKGSSPLDFSINTNDIEKELKSIEQLIAKLYINHWDESVASAPVRPAWVGGRRKTQKKHKTQKKRTQK